MKKTFFLTTLIVGIVLMSSCSKEDSNAQDPDLIKTADYTSSISQDRMELAKNLVTGFAANPSLLTFVTSECAKKFDGDNNVLCNDLFSKPVGKLKSTGKTLGELIGIKLNNSNSSLKSAPTGNSNYELLTQDPLVQLYFCKGLKSKDTTNIDGIVVLPQPYDEKKDKRVLLVKNDGTITTILENENEDKNYIVISRNERTGKKHDNSKGSHLKSAPNYTIYKTMAITRAKFISLDDKRTYESRWAGEPEVVLTITWAYFDHATKTWVGAKPTTCNYPEKWINSDIFTNWVVWNNTNVETPTWYYTEQSFYRNLKWIEDDGAIKASETEIETKDANGLSIRTKVKVDASDNYSLIYENPIDYISLKTGTNYWGALQFDIKSESVGNIPANVVYE